MRNTLYLIRGMASSGKRTLAKQLLTSLYQPKVMVATDDYFVGADGVYRFDHSKLTENHGKCEQKAVTALSEGCNVIVHNTFSCRWEMEPYLKAAKECGAEIVVIDLFDGGCTNEELLERSGRSIPVFVLERMRTRWEHNWRNPNPHGFLIPLSSWEKGGEE
jgi:predicted kinase